MADLQNLYGVWRAMGSPEAWVAGGWVRDRLLGRASSDVDIVIKGDGVEVKRAAQLLARKLGVRAHLLGREPRSIWRVVSGELEVEISALGEFSLEDDITRRDFSCNALMWRLPDGPVIDHVGGAEAIRKRRLVGISRSNFESDPLRTLRGSRFLAQFPNFDIDERTARWIRELAPLLPAWQGCERQLDPASWLIDWPPGVRCWGYVWVCRSCSSRETNMTVSHRASDFGPAR
jgi:tRNA nucleotidyltransferase/poly(A) polymerase